MGKSKIISVPLTNHDKLVELSYLVRDKKAKRLYFSMEEFYFELYDNNVKTKK
jgi:hypothetical protein